MIKLSPSILAANFTALGDDIRRVEAAGAEYLHIDVMDGCFVPNITFGPGVVRAIRAVTGMTLDVHLMIDRPERYIGDFADAGADILTIHTESTADPAAVLREIARRGVRPAVSVKPNTPVECVFGLLPLCSMVLVMTVEPGFGGQALIPETLEKLPALTAELGRLGLSGQVELEVDGGITPDNVAEATSRGANVIVAGSAVFRAPDVAAAVASMRARAQN